MSGDLFIGNTYVMYCSYRNGKLGSHLSTTSSQATADKYLFLKKYMMSGYGVIGFKRYGHGTPSASYPICR